MLNYERAAVYIPRPWLRLGPVDQCGLTNVYVHTYVPTRLVVVRFLKVLDVPVACALLASLKYAYSPCVLSSFLRCWCWLIFIFFFSSFPFRFRFGHRLFTSCLFLVGTMLSPRFRFLLQLVYHMIYFEVYTTSIYQVCILIRTYADLTFSSLILMSEEVYDLFQLLCVLPGISCFYSFPSWGNFPLQSYWSLSCDHGLHCSHELMREQQQQQSPDISAPRPASCAVCYKMMLLYGTRYQVWNRTSASSYQVYDLCCY